MYVVILAFLLFLSSGILYSAFASRLERRFVRFPHLSEFAIPVGTILPRQQDVLQDLLHSLLKVNGILLLGGGILSYWLASVTLQPIQAAFERQRRFLGDASHELRTPLTILKMDFENVLADSQLPAGVREQVKSHLEEVDRMAAMVGDLLILSRMDDGEKPEGHETMLPIHTIVKSAAERFKPMADQHGVVLKVQDVSEAGNILVNEDWFSRAFVNVIKNAIIYNKKGGVVDIAVERTPHRVAIRVTDTGIGISPADRERVFERFYRVDQSRSRQTGGSGLGLSIAQSSMARLGGEIRMESERGTGTTVTLLLPLPQAS